MVKDPASLAHTSALWLLCIIVGTMPLLFGAVHPVVLGGYVFLLLVGLGGWLVFTAAPGEVRLLSWWTMAPLLLVGWLLFQALPLPLALVEILSPQRAARVVAVNELAGTAIGYLPLSENGPAGFYRSFLLVALLIYYWCLTVMIRRDGRTVRWLLYSMAAVGAFEAIYGLMQFVNPAVGMLWLKIPGRAAHGTIIYKNQFASLLNMIWPLMIAALAVSFAGRSAPEAGAEDARKKPKQHRFFQVSRTEASVFGAAAVPMLLAVLFSLSRGGILALLLVALLLVVMLPFTARNKLIALGLAVVLVGGYGALLGWDTVLARFGAIDASGDSRLRVYLLSLPILFDHLLTGIGLESYTLLSPIYLTDFPATVHFDRAHNEFLELTLELGLPMALLFLAWLVAGLLKTAANLARTTEPDTPDRSRRILAIAAFCAVLGFLAHGLVDFGWRLPANLLYAVTLLAIVHGVGEKKAKKGTDLFFVPKNKSVPFFAVLFFTSANPEPTP